MSQLVLVLAPVGRDAAGAIKVFQNAGILAKPCRNLSHLCELLRMEGDSVGALILTEEALVSPEECSNLTDWIEHQEPWSELPIVFLTHPGQPTAITWRRSRVLSLRSALIILERPVRAPTLIAALRVALQSRERQYKLRDLLQSQHRAGIELLRAQLEAETANRAKDQFLATLSHELRTPLNAISGWTYLMTNERKDEALIEQGLEVVQRNTSALIGLISDLLDTAKISAGTLTMDFKEIDLKQVIKASVETFRVQAAQKDILLTSAVMIPEPGHCNVWGDEPKLNQILANLLNNALKFTPPGGAVTTQLSEAQATAIIVVKDSGKGISREFLPNIFNRFSQDKGNHGESGGLGLGLAICKHLVELHGGSISAESAGPGLGTTIKVALPTITAKFEPIVEGAGSPTSKKKEIIADTRLKDVTVLGVDHNDDSRELLKTILNRSCAVAKVVSSGKEALITIKDFHPDVLICDLAMPGMDGYEVLTSIRRLEPQIRYLPAIAFTTATRDEDRAATQRAGFQAHLAKPIDPEELVTTILALARDHKNK